MRLDRNDSVGSVFRRAVSVFAALAGTLGTPSVTAEPAVEEALKSGPLVRLDTIRVENGEALGTLTSGQTARLTLDAELQSSAHRLLQKAHPLAGAAVMVDVASGRVLVLDSYRRRGAPRGNPLTVAAPAASLFKIVTSAALFQHTRVEPETRVCFSGGERSIERQHLEPPAAGDMRCAPFRVALGHSWNAVYAQLATQHLMRDQLLETATGMGFNTALPFDIEATLGNLSLPYNDLEFARAAAGFQGSTLTPIGATQLVYGVALQGRAVRMKLIDEYADYKAPREREYYGQLMSPNAAWRLTRMMEVTVHGGTSLQAFTKQDGGSYLGSIRVAGKTGTLKRTESSPTTSWFTGFAPSRKPEVVVTVLLQNGDVWREKANEVARDLLRAYFAGKPGVTSPLD